MIGRRTAVGLSLLCALAVCAFVAQSASAAAAKNTTAVTCVKGGGSKDFSDAHCDKFVGAEKGEFGHVAITGTVAISVTNEKTASETKAAAPTILKGSIFGIKSEITCQTVTGEGSLTNEEPESKVHQVKGSVKAKFTNCSVQKPAGCKVKEPISVNSKVKGVEGIGTTGKQMGLEFEPESGKVFSEVTLEGCIGAGTFKTEGTAIGTGTPSPEEKFSGATNVFTNAMTKETLKLAGAAAEVSSTTTVTGTVGGNPVALTTTT
jgi:hypothetical protein